MSGPFMLPGEVTVTVTREEDHQQHLARYPVTGAQLVAELAWCTVTTGKHQGQRAIEVRLDSVRVGELTHVMSDRYGALVSEVIERGHRPGCAAVLHDGKRGIEVTLRLPRADTAVVVPLARTADSPQPSRPRRRKPVWVAAAVVGGLLIISAIASKEDKPAPPAAAPTVNGTTVNGTAAAPVTTTTIGATTTTAAPAPTSVPVVTTTVPTTKKPSSTKQTPTTTSEPKPPAEPQDAAGCDPNYTPCVPIASDVDCAGGKGNGPAYVSGPITVIGEDIYKLDNNNDGIGCE
ncbi:hypothetical protein [Kibdelosporangium phytohabitans]|uniref:Excalibur calcium-binding domain-containing protein n=1 Tax=Kibdelosporangium phytohabitans TaxID=860235 RepID=A0A0N9I229_9PSEU|nr:hypothetical protein [Kibdelosporangium phytohabitans]ALG08773.1 hypothetical protein AOZ06_19290 [Kibdelosporangium phytohabitans]MBE1470100.1 hypothetical protein [Kibdelosporangium phytohabitans]